MLIAAGDTPTIMMEYDYPKVAQWANDGAMTELDLDAFAQVAPTYYQKMVDNDQLQYTDLNGKTYFALSERPYYNVGYTFATFVRKDWLDKVGLGVPQNYTEYCAAIDAIMAAGLTDQAPIGYSLPATAYVPNFPFRATAVNESEWAMHSSLGTASLSWEPTKNYLKRQNAEFNKGYLSKEFELDVAAAGAGTASQAQTDFINGKTYSYAGYMSANVSWLTAFYENNPDAQLAVASVDTPVEPGVVDVATPRADNPFGMIVGFSSLATADQLKAAWMYMEWMSQPETLFTLENGVEGVTYNLGDNGLPVVVADYTGDEMLNHNCNIDMTCIVHAIKVTGTIEDSIKAITPQGLPQDFYQELLDQYNDLTELSKYAYTDPIFATTIASESEYSASLLALYQEYYAKLVKCDPAEFDTLYADLSQKYLDAGYQEIIDERLEAYNNGLTTKLPANLGQ
jgi:putative aldouronate transport system substrate-binding protein